MCTHCDTAHRHTTSPHVAIWDQANSLSFCPSHTLLVGVGLTAADHTRCWVPSGVGLLLEVLLVPFHNVLSFDFTANMFQNIHSAMPPSSRFPGSSSAESTKHWALLRVTIAVKTFTEFSAADLNFLGELLKNRVNLAYTCVKPLVRLYVCQRVAFFMTHFGSILGPFWVHLGNTDSCLNTDASLGFRFLGFQGLNQYLDKNQHLDKNQPLDKNTSETRILV